MRLVGVDIGGTSIKLGVFNEIGIEQELVALDTDSGQGGKQIINAIINEIERFKPIDAIGVSTAGQVDNKQGVIVQGSANIPGTSGLHVKQLLKERFNVPVAVENDVNAAALGENHFGVGKDLADFLFLTYGTGVGGAIVSDAAIYYGKSGFAGEFGHMVTHTGGKRCNCGLQGCYETYASTTALVNEAVKIDSTFKNGKIIMEEFAKGDQQLNQLVQNWIHEIAAGLTTLTHIFNPSTIIVGGGIMEQEVIVKMIREQVNTQVLDSFRVVDIRKASLGNKAGMLGAISLHL